METNGLPQVKDKELIFELQNRGFFVTHQPKESDIRFKPDLSRFLKGDWLRFGVVADVHLGSRYQQLTHLHTFYQRCASLGVKTVLHCGDLVDGEKMYRGHEYELFLHGADAQRDYAVANYPKEKGIKTHLIGGNHDESFWKTSGIDVPRLVAEQRKDICFLGWHGAYLDLDGLTVYLHHGQGGVAYARSYKGQKLIEQLAPEAKPNLLFQGHFHVMAHLPMYRNVVYWQMPCFQAQTPYLRARGLYPEVAGLIVEVRAEKAGVAEVRFQVVPFYVMKEKDY